MTDFRKLLVWQKAHALSTRVTKAAVGIRGRDFAPLRNQIIRAAQSIPSNIVEGRSAGGPRDFARFLGYAIMSASELEYHLMAARDLGLLSEGDHDALAAATIEVRKMLYGLVQTLRRDG